MNFFLSVYVQQLPCFYRSNNALKQAHFYKLVFALQLELLSEI